MATDTARLRIPRRNLPFWRGGRLCDVHRLWCCCWLLAAATPCCAQDLAAVGPAAEPIDLVMFQDPPLEIGAVKLVFPAGLKELWLKAMARPDSELQRLAADSFALADQRGLTGLEDAHAHLATLLRVPEQDAGVLRAAAHALIQLDARAYAGLLADTAAAQGLTMSLLVEPALARWKSGIMTDAWLSRIDDPRAGRAARILAIESLGETGEARATDSLKRLAGDSGLTPNERLTAARALSKMQAPGLVGLATTLIEAPAPPALLHQTLALELVQREDGAEALALLRQLAADVSPAVQSGALRRLYTIDPKHVYDFAEAAIGSKDEGVRTVGAQALLAKKDLPVVAPLASLLNDVNPTLRRDVARGMVQLAADPALHAEVIKQATAVLHREAWRGIEQAAVVLVLLDHKPAGDRLAELLDNARGEVKIASAWGLRRLAVPKHLPAMLAAARRTHDAFLAGNLPADTQGADLQSAQLFMAFGQMRYLEAEPLLMLYVPKDHSVGMFSRAAAVWTLGLLHAGQAPPELTASLVERLADFMSLEPESDDVRRMSAISLGRLKSTSAVAELRRIAAADGGYPRRACYWALERLSGEAVPPPVQFQVSFSDWFLVPAK